MGCGRTTCKICGREIKSYGFATYSHGMSHVRKDEGRRILKSFEDGGGWDFIPMVQNRDNV